MLGPLKIRVIAPAGVLSLSRLFIAGTQKPLSTSHSPINTFYMPSITINGTIIIFHSQKNLSTSTFISIHHHHHNLARMSLLMAIHVSVLFGKSKKV